MSTTPFLPLEAACGARTFADRATPSYRAVILTSIRDIDAARWDEAVGGAAVLRSHAYLDAIERAGLNDSRYFYPVIYDADERLVACACVYTIVTDFAQLLPPRLARWVARLRRWWPSLAATRITECAAPMAAGHGITIRAGVDRAAVLIELERAIAAIAAREGSGLIVIRDFTTEECAANAVLLEHGYAPRLNMPLARIRVRWKSYEDYLGAMRTRYRKDVRRRLQRAAERGLTVSREANFGAQAAIWLAQAEVVLARAQRFKRERPTAAYYACMDERLGARSLMLIANRDGRQVAHGMVLTDDEHTVTTFFGREAGPPGAEWFSLMNEAIRLGIERGSRYIHLGLGSYDAKSLVGADIEPLYVYCKTRHAALNWLIRRLPEFMALKDAPQWKIFQDV
ncbi:MAG: peptidogalycan biosysnthesis protein [Gammaproteobacteria bacterium]